MSVGFGGCFGSTVSSIRMLPGQSRSGRGKTAVCIPEGVVAKYLPPVSGGEGADSRFFVIIAKIKIVYVESEEW